MAKLPTNFNWRESSAHIDLLDKFVKPRNVAQVLTWQYLPETLKETTKDALERFIREGVLKNCDIEDALYCAFTAVDLKKMAKEQGVSLAGTKAELIERLIASDRVKMGNVVSKLQIMKCTPQAAEFVLAYQEKLQRALESTKQKCFDLLLKGQAKEAYKVFLAYQREYIEPGFESRTYAIEKMNFILTSKPKVLNPISLLDLQSLRAAICMSVLFYNEPSDKWIPDNFTTHLKSNIVAINYLKVNAELREELSQIEKYAKKARIVFDDNDVDSCELCTKLNGKMLDLKDFPELPFENCTSDVGCRCRIETTYDDDPDYSDNLAKIEFFVDTEEELQTAY